MLSKLKIAMQTFDSSRWYNIIGCIESFLKEILLLVLENFEKRIALTTQCWRYGFEGCSYRVCLFQRKMDTLLYVSTFMYSLMLIFEHDTTRPLLQSRVMPKLLVVVWFPRVLI